jgi:hypothetical protein
VHAQYPPKNEIGFRKIQGKGETHCQGEKEDGNQLRLSELGNQKTQAIDPELGDRGPHLKDMLVISINLVSSRIRHFYY